jgi:hypothetical protein
MAFRRSSSPLLGVVAWGHRLRSWRRGVVGRTYLLTRSWTTDRTFPAGSVNQAIKRPWLR